MKLKAKHFRKRCVPTMSRKNTALQQIACLVASTTNRILGSFEVASAFLDTQ